MKTAQEIRQRALLQRELLKRELRPIVPKPNLEAFKKLFAKKTREMYKKRAPMHRISPQEWPFSERETRGIGAVEYAESLGFKLQWYRLFGSTDVFYNNIIVIMVIIVPDE